VPFAKLIIACLASTLAPSRQVSQAFCAALRRLLGDWQLVVAQLEHQLRTGRLTLQGLQFYCQGPCASLGLLAGVASRAAGQGCAGWGGRISAAGLLNLLSSTAAGMAGDVAAQALLHQLLSAAAAPYFRHV
jgi:gamma-tubulin complex component 2